MDVFPVGGGAPAFQQAGLARGHVPDGWFASRAGWMRSFRRIVSLFESSRIRSRSPWAGLEDGRGCGGYSVKPKWRLRAVHSSVLFLPGISTVVVRRNFRHQKGKALGDRGVEEGVDIGCEVASLSGSF